MSLCSTRCTMFVALLAWATLPLAAQTNTEQRSNDVNYVQPSTVSSSSAAPAPDSGDYKPSRFQVFGGYSWLNSNSTLTGTTIPAGTITPVPNTVKLKDANAGFVVDVSYFFNKWIGITFDTGAHFGNNYNYAEALVGPTVRFPAGHLQPFIHALGGWTDLNPKNLDLPSNQVFGLAGGGGLDLVITKNFSLRLAQADYIYAQHNYGAGNPTFVDAVRLSAGIVLNAGGGEALPVASSCSVDKTEVWAGEPVKATVSPSNFNPKHTLKYDWTTNGGKVQGQGASVNVDTTGVAEGQSYNISVQVSDPKDKKALTSCQTSFATKKRLPPTISCTGTPNSVIQGGAVTIHCDASSPQGGPVNVAVTSDCGASGQGTDVSIDTSRLQPGACNVTGTVTDDHQLTATTTTSFTVQPKPLPPPPPPPVAPPPTLVLRSVYFATAQPTEENPNGGLVKSQEATLTEIASEFNKYLAVKPDAKLIIEAHADPRGSEEYNQKLTERRAQRVKSFLVEHGVPEGNVQPVGLGIQHQLTPDEVREQVQSNSDLTPNERTRILRNMRIIVLASNRRVDLRVTAPGVTEQTSVHKFPWSAADALSLIGGREKRAPAKAPARKRPARKKK